ncbi:hypothetical protein [Mycoplasma sp. Ms02]|uniref:hypothetical protein n=1 Tax=Mycoplasma sp. Ms02 TaxID=353851 RepID=UPI001C89AF62|nr:hypothetical protein [Mycoplasma sp. Ms02]QZE12461.1 hypothetical protein K4L35_00505 [Mycoplasma sp. Ms02]
MANKVITYQKELSFKISTVCSILSFFFLSLFIGIKVSQPLFLNLQLQTIMVEKPVVLIALSYISLGLFILFKTLEAYIGFAILRKKWELKIMDIMIKLLIPFGLYIKDYNDFKKSQPKSKVELEKCLAKSFLNHYFLIFTFLLLFIFISLFAILLSIAFDTLSSPINGIKVLIVMLVIFGYCISWSLYFLAKTNNELKELLSKKQNFYFRFLNKQNRKLFLSV